MIKPFFEYPSVTVLLFGFFSITQIFNGVYLARGAEVPPVYLLLRMFATIWILGWWLKDDLSKHRGGGILDLGMFLSMAWPLIMPYHLVRTRGVKSLLPMLVFAVIYLAPLIVGAFVRVLVTFPPI
jgi:hypothetical protein